MGRLRTPWTGQPNISVGVNWSNPITRGLVFAANGATGVDAVSGARAVRSGSSTKSNGLGGVAHKSPTTQIAGAFTYTVNIASSFDCTVVVVNRNITAQAANTGVPTLHFNSTESVMFSTTGSQSIFSTTNNPSKTITTLATGRVYVLSGVKRVNSQEQYVDGYKVTTDVTGNRAVGAITTISVGRPAGGNNIENSEYYEVLYFNRALTPTEIKSLSENPWQIFQPLARNVFSDVPAAGGSPYTLTADTANIAIAGQATGLAFNRVLTADTANTPVAGQATTLAFNRVLTADTANIPIAGSAATLAFNRVLTADTANIPLAGQDATLTYTPVGGSPYTMIADTANVPITGADAGLSRGYTLAADTANIAISGSDAALIATRKLIAESMAIALAGADATLTYTPLTLPTVGRPTSDTSNTGWTPSTGVDLYPMVDEVTPDALDYISTTAIGSICKMALSTTAYPGTASQQLKFRASSSTGNSVIVRLKEGATTIRSATQVLTAVDTEYTLTLTSGEIAAITSGSLSVELESA